MPPKKKPVNKNSDKKKPTRADVLADIKKRRERAKKIADDIYAFNEKQRKAAAERRKNKKKRPSNIPKAKWNW